MSTRILVVEDSPVTIEALVGVLREQGYQVHVATSGKKALEKLDSIAPDLILLDVMMPEVDGFETCAQIKATCWSEIPIIFLTSRAEPDDIVRGFEVGAVDYVAKPFHAHELLARVGTHLAVYRLRRENERLIRDESELARHRSVAQMVAGVAHEINTPLGILNTAASLLNSWLGSPVLAALGESREGRALLDDLGDATQLITRNVARAHRLVQDFKKVSVQQVTDTLEQVELAEVVDETVRFFQVGNRESPLEVEVLNQLPDGRGPWLGYPGSLSQVLLNLLSNARRYAYPGRSEGQVKIELGSEGESYRICVRDFGAGIPAANLPRVFEPFFTTGRGQGGSGLGMSIVHMIVTAHLHGEIAIESKEGEGTSVTFRIPLQILQG